MVVDEAPPVHALSSAPSYGTPIRLAPSAAAFRKPGQSPVQGQQRAATVPTIGLPGAVPAGQSPGKGMLGQVSDLIFGW